MRADRCPPPGSSLRRLASPMRRPASRGYGKGWIVVTLLLLPGCDVASAPPQPLWTSPLPPGVRTFVDVSWERAWSIGTGEDVLLASPRHLTVVDSILVWWDDYDHRIFAVGTDGVPRWSFGGEGEGPDEFRSVGDVGVDADGTILALDSDNGRITRLSPHGRRIGHIRLPEGYWRSLAPQPDGSLILAGVDAGRPFTRIDGDGTIKESHPAPWDGFRQLSLIQRQGKIIAGRDGRWAYMFLVGNGWFSFRGDVPLGYLGRFIEHTDFPEMVVVSTRADRISKLVERPSCSACAGWLTGDTLRVLFGGYGEHRHQVVDRYAWADGTYLGSVLLPRPARDVVVLDELTVVLEAGMVPEIVAYSRQGNNGR